MIETLRIVLLCVFSAIVYGIIHDQVTARVCLEYFTVFHPPVFSTHSPTLLAFGWGIIATWWVGLLLGLLLVVAARFGPLPKLSAKDLLRPVEILLTAMACCAASAGLGGFMLAGRGVLVEPLWMAAVLAPSSYPGFVANSYAHLVSYGSGMGGGMVLCFLQDRRRIAFSA